MFVQQRGSHTSRENGKAALPSPFWGQGTRSQSCGTSCWHPTGSLQHPELTCSPRCRDCTPPSCPFIHPFIPPPSPSLCPVLTPLGWSWLSCSVSPQELHRAAVCHERDEGGAGADPAALRALARPCHASPQNHSDHPSLQERDPPVFKENPLMLENILPSPEGGTKQMTGQCFSGAEVQGRVWG